MKVIFARNSGFGDVIWTEPLVRYLLSKGEDVLIQTAHPCVFDNYPSIRLQVNLHENIFPMEQWPIELRFEAHPQSHVLAAFYKQAGIIDAPLCYPELHLSSKEKERVIPEDYAVIHIDRNAKDNFRNVYGTDWGEVVRFIRSKGLKPVQISKTGEGLAAPWFPTSDFREIMSLLYRCKLFIGLDSGPSHIAACMRVPSVIFFGSVNPEYRHLDRKKKVFLQSPCPVPQLTHCYHQRPNQFGVPCRLVTPEGEPPCCVQDTSRVLEAIDLLYRR